MSEAISAENIEEVLRQRLFDLTATVDTQEVSHVAEVGDGIAHIFGLKSAMAGELLEFTSSATGETVYGLAQNLDRDEVGAVLRGSADGSRGRFKIGVAAGQKGDERLAVVKCSCKITHEDTPLCSGRWRRNPCRRGRRS